MKAIKISERMIQAARRLAYRQDHGEKPGERHYDYNAKALEEAKQDLKSCFDDGSWNEPDPEDWR